MTGRAVQIASFDADTCKLKLHKPELDGILNQPHLDGLFIAVYSFVDADGTGKSFTLSILERYLRSNIDLHSTDWLAQLNDNDEPLLDDSIWRSGSKGAETRGIWAWSEVFVVDGPDDQKVGLLLMGTQGLFDGTNTDQLDGKIFTLSSLISSIQIFNVKNIMEEDKLANLHLLSAFGRRTTSTHSSSIKAFQRIIFLIQDWQCPTEFPSVSEGGRRYIEEFFNISREMGGTADLAQRRQYIGDSFDQVDCYLIPFPGTELTDGDASFTGRLSEMDDDFKKHLEKFINFLFPDGMVQPKTTAAGTRVLASDLSSYIEYFVNLLNSDETLSDQSIFQATTAIHDSSVARNAVKGYKTCVTALEESNTADTPLSVDNMELQHEAFYLKALNFFEQHQMGDADSNSPILDQLKKDLVTEFENWKKRNELVEAQIINSNKSALKEAKKMYSSTMDDWFNSNKTKRSFIEMNELMDQHHRIKQNTTEFLKNQLKGGPEFSSSFIQRLSQFVEAYFHKYILAENESNRKHEEFRADMTNLINQLEKQREENEKAIRSTAEAEIEYVKAESEKKQREDELKTKEEEEAAKRRSFEHHNKFMIAQIERIKYDMEKAIQEEREHNRKEVEKLRAEEAKRRTKRERDQEERDKDREEGIPWSKLGDFLLQAVPAVLNFIPDFNERN